MKGSRAAEGQEAAAGLQDAEGFGGPGLSPELIIQSGLELRGCSFWKSYITTASPPRWFSLLVTLALVPCFVWRVPFLAHELKSIGRVGYDSVDWGRLHVSHREYAVSVDYHWPPNWDWGTAWRTKEEPTRLPLSNGAKPAVAFRRPGNCPRCRLLLAIASLPNCDWGKFCGSAEFAHSRTDCISDRVGGSTLYFWLWRLLTTVNY